MIEASLMYYHKLQCHSLETFQIPAVAAGQRFRTVPFTVQSRFSSVHHSSPRLKSLQKTRNVRRAEPHTSRTTLRRCVYICLLAATYRVALYPGYSLRGKRPGNLPGLKLLTSAALELALHFKFQNVSRNSCRISIAP